MEDPIQVPTQHYTPAIDSHFPRVKQTYPIDVSIERRHYQTLFPINHDTDYLKDSFVEFSLDSEPGSFLDLSSILLEANLQLLKFDGSDPGEGDVVIFTNGLIHALIRSRKLFLNSQLVESDQHSNLTRFINTMSNVESERLYREGTSAGYFAESMGGILNKSVAKADFLDAQRTTRNNFRKKGLIQVCGPLDLDLGKSNMLLPDRLNGRLHLDLADISQLIQKPSDDANSYKIKIYSIKLHYERVIPVTNAYLEFNKSLMSNNLEYHFQRQLVYKCSVSSGQQQAFISQPFGSLVPQKIKVFMINQSAHIGNDKSNTFYFDHFDLTNLKVAVNHLNMLESDVKFPSKYATLYNRVLRSMEDPSIIHSINYADFSKGLSIFSVDLSNSKTNSLLQLEQRGHLDITMEFGTPLANAINIFVIGFTVGTLEIDFDRRITTHYNY